MNTFRHSRGFVLICLIISLVILIQTSASADQGTPNLDGQKPYPYDPEFTSIMDQPFLDSNPTVQAPLHDVDYRDYEQIVFQSDRAENWEIYTQQGYGSAVNITVESGISGSNTTHQSYSQSDRL